MRTRVFRTFLSLGTIILSMTVCRPCCGGTDESALVQVLRTQSLRGIVGQLKSGGVPPPLFTSEVRLDPSANRTLPLLLELLKKERAHALTANFTEDAYANDLADFYRYFDQFNSYASVVLCDISKRMLLEWAQVKILTNSNAEALNRVSSVLAQTAIQPSRMKVFFGPDAKPEWLAPEELRGRDLNEMSQRVWESHGYHQVSGGYRGTAQVLSEHGASPITFTSNLIGEYKPVDLSLRVLTTESIRVVSLGGTIEFLRRGGEVDKVNLADVRYFRSVMPWSACSQYTFAPLGVRYYDAGRLMGFLGKMPIPAVPELATFDPHKPWMYGLWD